MNNHPQNRRVEDFWHMDKRIPIALIVTICVQFEGIVMYISTLASRTIENERRITVLEAQKISERLAALESQVFDTKALLLRVDSKIDGISKEQRSR